MQTSEVEADDSILAQADPQLQPILEEAVNSHRTSVRSPSPTESAMSLRSGTSRATEKGAETAKLDKNQVKALRDQIKVYEPTYRGRITNQTQLEKAQDRLAELIQQNAEQQQQQSQSSSSISR